MLDTVIRNGKVIDGAGNPWFYADIGIKDGRVVQIRHRIEDQAVLELDARGLFVCPGFIDMHSHSDFTMLIDHRAQSKVQQGITTELNGQCGGWAAPLRGESLRDAKEMFSQYGVSDNVPWSSMYGYLAHLESVRPTINQAILVGHGTVRAAVFGYEQREPTKAELDEMKVLTKEAMKAGAFGLSTGLYYAPGSYAETPEIVEVCKVVAELGGIHESHIRDESDYNIGLVAALKEVIDIGAESGVSTQIAHLKALGPRQWGKASVLLEMIDNARADGHNVTFDQYPYHASNSSITGALLPRWAQEGGRAGTLAKLADSEARARIREDMLENLDRRGGADRLLIALYPPERDLHGKTLQEAATEKGVEPVDLAMDMLQKADASLVSFVMSDEDVDLIMKHPAGMVGSDGWALASDGPTSAGHPHPRSFGTFPRVLGLYAREKRVLTFEEAVRKMTSAAASKLGIGDRGLLRERNWADIVVFDPETVQDEATFDRPKQYPTGIKWVFVNGAMVVKEGRHQAVFPGHVLRKRC